MCTLGARARRQRRRCQGEGTILVETRSDMSRCQHDPWRAQYLYFRPHRLTLIEPTIPSTMLVLTSWTSASRPSGISTLKFCGLWTIVFSPLFNSQTKLYIGIPPPRSLLYPPVTPLQFLCCVPCPVSSMYQFNCTSSHSYSQHVYPSFGSLLVFPFHS